MSIPARRLVPLLLPFLVACATRLPPALRAPHPVTGAVVVLRPAVALGPDVSPEMAGRLEELLDRELAASLRRGGIEVAEVDPGRIAPARDRLVRAAPRLLAAGPSKVRGREAVAPPALGAVREAGGRLVILPLLARRGPVPDEKGFLPREDDLVDISDQRRSWVMDTLSRKDLPAPGLSLRLLLVDAATGKVLDVREVAEPAADPSSWGEAVVSLARMAARGVAPAGQGGAR